MTRQHITKPLWAWHCDTCGFVDGRRMFEQSQLPSPEQMRDEGWHIAKLWGDACHRCANVHARAAFDDLRRFDEQMESAPAPTESEGTP